MSGDWPLIDPLVIQHFALEETIPIMIYSQRNIVLCHSQMLHVWNIYLHFLQNDPNVGTYSLHGGYGITKFWSDLPVISPTNSPTAAHSISPPSSSWPPAQHTACNGATRSASFPKSSRSVRAAWQRKVGRSALGARSGHHKESNDGFMMFSWWFNRI